MIKKWKSKLLFKLQYVQSFSCTISCSQWLITKKEFFCKKQGQDPARNWAKPVKDINGLHLFPYNLWVFSSFCSTILSQLVVICLLLCHLLLKCCLQMVKLFGQISDGQIVCLHWRGLTCCLNLHHHFVLQGVGQFVTSKEYTWIPMKLPAIASNQRKLSPISCHEKSSFQSLYEKVENCWIKKKTLCESSNHQKCCHLDESMTICLIKTSKRP